MNIVLLNPEIPYNTGNIGRTCVLTNTTLHLIKPLGFSIDEKSVRRAGLDYWNDFIMFGPESRGIPEDVLNRFKANNITIPMLPIGRSLNLSNSVAIVLYEGLRQLGFNY